MAQTVKHLPAMRETWVRFLGREDPLEKQIAGASRQSRSGPENVHGGAKKETKARDYKDGVERFRHVSKWQPAPALLPGKSCGWRSLIGYSPLGHKESDTTERLHFLSL